MSKKNKIILLSVSLTLFVLVIGASYFSGKILEEQFKLLTREIQKNKDISFAGNFDRGLFSSRFDGKLSLNSNGETFHFNIDFKSIHLLFRGTADLNLPEQSNLLSKAIVTSPEIQFRIVLLPLVGIQYSLSSTPFKTKATEVFNQFVDSRGLNLFLEQDFDGNIEYAEFQLHDLEYKEGILSKKFKDLSVIYKADINKNFGNYELEGKIEEFSDESNSFGPGIIQVAALRIDTSSLNKVKKLFKNFSPESIKNEQFKSMAMMTGMNVLNSVIKHSPILKVPQLRVRTSNGEFSGRMTFEIDGSKNPSFLSVLQSINLSLEMVAEEKVATAIVGQVEKVMALKNLRNPATALKGKEGQKILQEIEKKSSENAKKSLQKYVDQNFVNFENGRYDVNFSYSKSVLMLNGRQVDPFTALKGGQNLFK